MADAEKYLDGCIASSGGCSAQRMLQRWHGRVYDQPDEELHQKLATVTDTDETSGFHNICKNGLLEVAMLKGQSLKEVIKLKDNSRRNPLHYICIEAHSELFRYVSMQLDNDTLQQLLTEMDCDNMSAFHYLCEGGTHEVDTVLDKHMSVHKIWEVGHGGECAEQPVVVQNDGVRQLACESDIITITKCIVERLGNGILGRMLKSIGKSGMSAFHMLCVSGNIGVLLNIDACLENGGLQELVLMTSNGRTLLDHAYVANKFEVCMTILKCMSKNGISEMLSMRLSRLPLFHFLCTVGHLEAILFIIHTIGSTELDLLIMTHDDNGCTPMHLVCVLGYVEAFRVILAKLSDGVLEKLLMYKVPVLGSLIHIVCELDRAEFILVLGDRLKEHVWKRMFTLRNNDNSLALQTALKLGRVKTLSTIVSAKHSLVNHCFQIVREHIILECCKRGATEAVINILNSASLGGNMLHWDILKGCLSATDKDHRNVLHMACSRGDKLLVREILRHLQRLSASLLITRTGHTVEILGHQDKSGRTVLHEACQQDDAELVQMLLDAALSMHCIKPLLLVGAQTRRTALLEAFETGNYSNVRNILDHAALVRCIRRMLSSTYEFDRTIFHRACVVPTTDMRCLLAVVDVARKTGCLISLLCDKDVLGRTFLSYISSAKDSVIQLLVKTVTDFEIEERKRTRDSTKSHVEFFLTTEDNSCIAALTYAQRASKSNLLTHFLTPFYDELVENNELHLLQQYHLLYTKEPRENYEQCKLENPLVLMGLSECSDLINHPYTTTYLDLCWKSYASYVFYANLILHLAVLFTLTPFVVSHRWYGNTYSGTHNVTTTNLQSTSARLSSTCQYLLLIFAFLKLVFDLLQQAAKGRHSRITLGHFTIIAISCASIVISVAPMFSGYSSWHHHLGIVTMGLAWVSVGWMLTRIHFVFLRCLQSLSLRFLMLFRVIRGVLIFVPVFAIFVVAFALVFHSVFQDRSSFASVGFSVFTILAMTIGELDYSNLFFPEEEDERSPYYVISYVMFTIFLGIMTISAMNLLVGLAVGDIGDLRAQSELLAFKSRVNFTLKCHALFSLLGRFKRSVLRQKG